MCEPIPYFHSQIRRIVHFSELSSESPSAEASPQTELHCQLVHLKPASISINRYVSLQRQIPSYDAVTMTIGPSVGMRAVAISRVESIASKPERIKMMNGNAFVQAFYLPCPAALDAIRPAKLSQEPVLLP